MTNQGTLEHLSTGFAYLQFLPIVDTNRMSFFKCPSDVERRSATNAGISLDDSTLSYFLSVKFGINKTNSILSGDRNLALDGVPVHRGSSTFSNYASLTWTTNIHSSKATFKTSGGSLLFLDGHAEWRKNSGAKLKPDGADSHQFLLP
jgi:prepilin-type processing-associated H-X9-DG protein